MTHTYFGYDARGRAGEERLSQCAREDVEGLGIEVRTGTPVSDLGADFVEIGSDHIAARTILWAAGVRASPLTSQLGVPIDRAGRVWVEEDLSVPNRPEVFVCGDLIAKTQDGKPLPGVTQLAMQSGRHAAHILFLVDFRRRIAVLFEWAWAYFTWQRRSRVILELPQELDPVRTTSTRGAGKARAA